MCLFMAQVNISIDDNLKEQGEILFKALGLNFSTAVNAFVSQAVRKQAIPFPLEISENPVGSKLQNAFRALQEEAKANGIDRMTMAEIDAEIDAYRQEKRGL
jgi:addiction module RelB/DinJ family antitoxin